MITLLTITIYFFYTFSFVNEFAMEFTSIYVTVVIVSDKILLIAYYLVCLMNCSRFSRF